MCCGHTSDAIGWMDGIAHSIDHDADTLAYDFAMLRKCHIVHARKFLCSKIVVNDSRYVMEFIGDSDRGGGGGGKDFAIHDKSFESSIYPI